MEIKIKLPVGQKAFFLINNKVFEATIVAADVAIGLSLKKEVLQRTIYTIDENPAGTQYKKRFEESEIFESKEALLKSL